MGWVGAVDGRYLTHPALRAPLQWRGSAVAELTLNTYLAPCLLIEQPQFGTLTLFAEGKPLVRAADGMSVD